MTESSVRQQLEAIKAEAHRLTQADTGLPDEASLIHSLCDALLASEDEKDLADELRMWQGAGAESLARFEAELNSGSGPTDNPAGSGAKGQSGTKVDHVSADGIARDEWGYGVDTTAGSGDEGKGEHLPANATTGLAPTVSPSPRVELSDSVLLLAIECATYDVAHLEESQEEERSKLHRALLATHAAAHARLAELRAELAALQSGWVEGGKSEQFTAEDFAVISDFFSYGMTRGNHNGDSAGPLSDVIRSGAAQTAWDKVRSALQLVRRRDAVESQSTLSPSNTQEHGTNANED